MARYYYGAKCAGCGVPMILGSATDYDPGSLIVYVPEPKQYQCTVCGSSHIYESDEIVHFEVSAAA